MVLCHKEIYPMNLFLKATLICLVLMMNACGNNEQTAPGQAPQPKGIVAAEFAPKPGSAESFSAGDLLYPWVDQLNVRETPSTSAKKTGTARKGQPVTVSGEKTDKKETIVLRGVAYDDYWIKVTTSDKTEGWVFAAALRREGEYKGNEVISDTRFNFQAFGEYDLSQWQKQAAEESAGGDAETTTTVYQKGDRVLEITHTELGDYGYINSYKLMSDSGELLKERELTFEVDPELLLRETVTDHLAGQRYVRSQPMSQHFMQLNARPLMATGEWTITEL